MKHGRPFSIAKVEEKHLEKPFILSRILGKIKSRFKRHKEEKQAMEKEKPKEEKLMPERKLPETRPRFKSLQIGGFEFEKLKRKKEDKDI